MIARTARTPWNYSSSPVDFGLLADGETIICAVAVILAASLSKFLVSLAGARLSFIPAREGAALGVGLDARGALEIVIATVGLSLGVLNDRSYIIVVLLAMATSKAAPLMLRRVLRNWEGTPEEYQRLDLEAQLAANAVMRGSRVLIPTRGGMSSLLGAQVTGLTWPDSTAVTRFTVGDGSAPDLSAHDAVLHHCSVEHEQVDAEQVADAIVAEARLGDDHTRYRGDPASQPHSCGDRSIGPRRRRSAPVGVCPRRRAGERRPLIARREDLDADLVVISGTSRPTTAHCSSVTPSSTFSTTPMPPSSSHSLRSPTSRPTVTP